jgi:hypothetical protein
MTTPRDGDPDGRLIDDAIAVVGDARSRAPADFLVALAVLLGSAAAVLLVAAAIASGPLQDLLLNLGIELIGALLTVVVIDGLWRRLEAAASSSLDEMATKLEEHRRWPMTDDERDAWRLFVDEYRLLVRAESLGDRLRALPSYRRRMRVLEERGNRTLAQFRPAVRDPSGRDPGDSLASQDEMPLK